jgi:purine-binding chemotaxis protein CheW
MKKRRISYRDWLNRAPQKPVGDAPVAPEPVAAEAPETVEDVAASAEPEIVAEVVAPAEPETDAAPIASEPASVPPAIAADAEQEAAPPEAEPATAAPVEHLVFRIGRELFALPLDHIEETFDVDRVQRIPEMSPTMLGVLTLRGATVPLYDPGVALGVAAGDRRSALVFVTERGRVALAVDDVDDVLVISADEIRRPPLDFGDGVLTGVARRGADLIGMLATQTLIAACRAEPALETA